MSELIKIWGTENQNRRGDVVFVHGLNGDAHATWQPEGQPDRFWPDWIGEDLPDVGVWSVGYPVNAFAWKGSTMPLADRAVNILVSLHTNDIGTNRPVMFITHSLGGLLVKEMLRKATDGSVPEGEALAKNTKGIVFLSTPHAGSNLANFIGYLKFLLPSVSVEELQTQEPRLRELNTWYRNNVGKLGIQTQVYCERNKTPSGKDFFGQLISALVVDATSSDPGIAGVTAVPMDDDHITISRPTRKSDLYLRISRFIDNCLTSLDVQQQSFAKEKAQESIVPNSQVVPGDVSGKDVSAANTAGSTPASEPSLSTGMRQHNSDSSTGYQTTVTGGTVYMGTVIQSPFYQPNMQAKKLIQAQGDINITNEGECPDTAEDEKKGLENTESQK